MDRSVTEAYEPAAAAKKRRRPSVLPLVVFAAQQRIGRAFERALTAPRRIELAPGPERGIADRIEAPARGVRITDIA